MSAKASNYFEVYDSLKFSEGVPNFQMNRPITPNTIKGELGIELEIEAITRLPRDGDLGNLVAPITKARWVAIADGSLRGESREYIVSTPVLEKEVEHMLYGLFDIFKEHKVILNNSNRCSTHVHYNMKGTLINELTSIIILWGTFEDYFIKMNGEERVSNHFCLPIRSTKGTIEAWDSFLRYGSMAFGRELKYSSLNLLPIFDKGSIEFRCGAAADEADSTFKWIKFLYAFSTYVRKTYKNPFLIAHDMSERGAYRILKAITDTDTDTLGDEYLNKICDGQSENEVNDTCLAAFRDVQSLALGFPWEVWLPLINKEYVPNPFDEASKKRPPPLQEEVPAILGGAGEIERLVNLVRVNPGPPLRQDFIVEQTANR